MCQAWGCGHSREENAEGYSEPPAMVAVSGPTVGRAQAAESKLRAGQEELRSGGPRRSLGLRVPGTCWL